MEFAASVILTRFTSAGHMLWLMYGALAVITLVTKGIDGYCTLPREWRGNWHQNRIGAVTITGDDISRKGRCVESRHDYYLLENRDIGCFTCLQIRQRHDNILQYKQSYCEGKNSLFAICGEIKITTIMQTLIRESSMPSPCPFHDAYHFSYNNNSGGFCREPSSYAKPCASKAQLRLYFKRCTNAAYTHERAVDLECLGTWREGSEHYMIGRLTGEGFMDDDTRYRCFMYNVFGTLVYVSMSSDASCFGVISPSNGPVVLEFTHDVFGWPVPSCEFPQWITNNDWKDLSGRHVYHSNSDRNILTEVFKSEIPTLAGEQKAYRCHKVLERNTTEDQFTLVSFTSHGCTSKYQCVRFMKRKDGIIEIDEGMFMEYENDPCLEAHMLTSNTKLLIPQNDAPRHCPLRGRYRIPTGSSVCAGYFRVGCNGTSVLDILSSCASKPGLQLQCLNSWKEHRRRFLVAKVLGDTSGTTNCFSFIKRNEKLHFAIDNECNKGAPMILKNFVTYVLDQEPESCDAPRKQVTKEVRSDNQSSRDNVDEDTQYGGSYKHVDEQDATFDVTSSNGHHSHHMIHHVVIMVLVTALYMLPHMLML